MTSTEGWTPEREQLVKIQVANGDDDECGAILRDSRFAETDA